MRKNTYKMASWWLLWEDLIFPEPGVEQKITEKAKKFKAAGIDTVVIFGCHFRWDYIYFWERLHHLLTFIVDTCHQHDIKVFDHHSANLTHRVDSLDEYRNITKKNRHHVPFFPSRKFADTITFNGHQLNDFRMRSVQNGEPCYLNAYNAEIFCMNNIHFVHAYQKYLELLLKTGIDGLMCDDIIYYPRWDGCSCEHCRKKFKDQYGHDLPPVMDENFWGNYESPEFKDWIAMRYYDPLDFLTAVQETLDADFPLMSCCSGSSSKNLNANGLSAEIMIRSMNHVMMEICGEIISEQVDYTNHTPNFMLHKAISTKHGYPNIGLGYAHNPDSAFVIWAFNKIFASSSWISTLTGRFGVAEKVRKTIPDEADIIYEVYCFEEKNKAIFTGESAAPLAVLFSLDNLMYNGCDASHYAQPWHHITAELFRQNVQFDVVQDIPDPENHPVLLLSHFDCVSSEITDQLNDYMKRGGIVIAAGLFGFRDERGGLKEKAFLSDLGVELRNVQYNWNIPVAHLFKLGASSHENAAFSYDVYVNGSQADGRQWIHSGGLYWLPQHNMDEAISKTKALLPPADLDVSCPDGWIYRILQDEDKCFVHLLALNVEPIPYEEFKNTILNRPIIKSLNFAEGTGEVCIQSRASQAVLHSPDLSESIKLNGVKGTFSFDLGQIKRYLIVEID